MVTNFDTQFLILSSKWFLAQPFILLSSCILLVPDSRNLKIIEILFIMTIIFTQI